MGLRDGLRDNRSLGVLGFLQQENEAMLHTELCCCPCVPEQVRRPNAVEAPDEEPAAHVEGSSCLVLRARPTLILVLAHVLLSK